jgi:sugar phosphate isomerase/epimerase
MISYQLYSSRNFPPVAETLRMVAALGYDAVEGYGGLYADANLVGELSAHLAATGLKMPSGHFGLGQIEDTPGEVIDIARMLGIGHVFCPYLMPGDRPTDAAGWRDFGARLQRVGEPIRAAGLGFGWHNHDFEVTALPGGAYPQDLIFEGGPNLEWEIDVAWVIRGGADPFDWIARYADRITAAHVKDIAPAGQNADEDGWADVGQGGVDWKGLTAALRRAGCDLFVLEHDNPSDDRRFARRSLDAVKGY